jgi:hypothetical protein
LRRNSFDTIHFRMRLTVLLVPAFPDDHPAIAALVAADRAALAQGQWHFGFTLWQKP